ncbi:MAG TPA: hypothetical protein VHC68_02190 [Candidatus Paceibacterota bacterium]|nr:hypothetical protein [Candidatus Paceibacterota bacterium]
MRKPIVVAIANYILPGLGYVLLGRRVGFGLLMMLGCAVQVAQLYFGPLPYIVTYGSSPLVIILGFSAIFIIEIAFAYDAYRLAKEPL